VGADESASDRHTFGVWPDLVECWLAVLQLTSESDRVTPAGHALVLIRADSEQTVHTPVIPLAIVNPDLQGCSNPVWAFETRIVEAFLLNHAGHSCQRGRTSSGGASGREADMRLFDNEAMEERAASMLVAELGALKWERRDWAAGALRIDHPDDRPDILGNLASVGVYGLETIVESPVIGRRGCAGVRRLRRLVSRSPWSRSTQVAAMAAVVAGAV